MTETTHNEPAQVEAGDAPVKEKKKRERRERKPKDDVVAPVDPTAAETPAPEKKQTSEPAP